MKYKISAPDPVSHYLEIEMHIEHISSKDLTVRLPSWRPGRYELGNFARNIQKWNAFDIRGKMLPFKKTSKDSWLIHTGDVDEVIIKYNYFAVQLDAGACRVDEDQVYINPVHCFLYIPERMHEKCFVELDLPDHYQTVTAMRILNPKLIRADDYHQLVDSPLMASASMQHNNYYVDNIMFNIWIQGTCKPDWARIIQDFSRFTAEQIKTMGSFPVGEFHFMVQALPYKFYHGVEHLYSTVLAIGPGSELMDETLYTDFVGVASHELFHVWNVKTVRPADLMPYDYSQENYSRLGFVYEGVTTYYGDLFLARSGVYDATQYFSEINVRLQKHMDHFGRMNMSVADASFDTWLDGYVPGIPHRKTSIYDEGCLTALMTDLLIRKITGSKASLDDVMKILYEDFGKQNRGYTEHDYLTIIENVAGESLADFFIDYVYGTEPFLPMLQRLLYEGGCQIETLPAATYCEDYFGFRTAGHDTVKIKAILPGSPAATAGLGLDDEVIAVNGIKVENNLDELCRTFSSDRLTVTLMSPMKKLKDITLVHSQERYYKQYFVRKMNEATTDQRDFFKSWTKLDF